MTAADKLRELLATRPTVPSHEELRSWWKVSAELLRPMLDERRRFPILGGPSILWSMIAPYDAQAKINHDQDLERLASRGGLAMPEVWCVVHGKRFREVPTDDVCEAWFLAWRDQHEGLRAELAALIAESARIATKSGQAMEHAAQALERGMAERDAARTEANGLRAELAAARTQYKSDVESFEAALATEAYEKGILDQVERGLRGDLAVAERRLQQVRLACETLADGLVEMCFLIRPQHITSGQKARRDELHGLALNLRTVASPTVTITTTPPPGATGLLTVMSGDQEVSVPVTEADDSTDVAARTAAALNGEPGPW